MEAEHSTTTAVTRKWSDTNPVTFLSTLGAVSFVYSLVGHPVFLLVSRQQVARDTLPLRSAANSVYRDHGLRGLFRGSPMSVSGTVLSEACYIGVLEYSKEYMPFQSKLVRDFWAGMIADAVSNLIFTPFSVVSQRQMTAGVGVNACTYSNSYSVARSLVKEEGVSALMRGTIIAMAMMPISGMWWLVYEQFKIGAYQVAPLLVPESQRNSALGSTTDNPIINACVASSTSILLALFLNPVYVLKIRVQVMAVPSGVRFRALWIAADIFRSEGVASFYKGLRGNLLMAAIGGVGFGTIYEGSKKIADVT